MRVIFMGTPDFAVGTLEALVKSEHEVVAVVTQLRKCSGAVFGKIEVEMRLTALLYNKCSLLFHVVQADSVLAIH